MPLIIVRLTGDLFFVEIVSLLGKGKNIYVFKFCFHPGIFFGNTQCFD